MRDTGTGEDGRPPTSAAETPAKSTSVRSPLIRAASGSDARALSLLMEEVYAEGRWFVGDGAPRPDTLARRIRGLDPTRELFLVAEARRDAATMPDGRFEAAEGSPRARSAGARTSAIIGWIEAHRYAPRRMAHVASFTLAVTSDVRGRGVGRALLRALTPWAQRVGVRKLRLDVRAGNTAARRLYESEGFVVEGIERNQVRCGTGDDPDFEDNVIMARFL